MIDKKIQKGCMLRSIRRALGYLEDAKRQYINSNYNRGVNYKAWARDEIKYVMETLTIYFK